MMNIKNRSGEKVIGVPNLCYVESIDFGRSAKLLSVLKFVLRYYRLSEFIKNIAVSVHIDEFLPKNLGQFLNIGGMRRIAVMHHPEETYAFIPGAIDGQHQVRSIAAMDEIRGC